MDEANAKSPWWTLAAVGIGTFMSALDGSVVNTVLPVLRVDLGASVAAIEWVTVVYLLVVSAILLGVGRAGDLYGHKRLYVVGFALFVAGSMLCGLAPNVHALVALRAIQALGAAMLFANAPAILTKSFPVAQRGRALGAQGTFTYLGLTVGPSLGGWLAHTLGWRYVFYINVPVGLFGIALALAVVADDRPSSRKEPFDWGGATLFTIGLVSLLVALNRGHSWGWTSPSTMGTFTFALVALGSFVAIEKRRAAPMLDLGLFRSRVFSVATTGALVNYVCIFGVVFVIPFLLIQGRGLNAQHTGLIMTAQPIVMAIVAPFSGAWSDRVGSRPFATGGLALLAGGLGLLSVVAASPSLTPIVAALGVIGLGVGLFVSPNNSALMGAAPRNRQGIAAGVLATARNVGMVLGVGLSGAILTTALEAGGGTSAALVSGVQTSLLTGAALATAGAIIVFMGE